MANVLRIPFEVAQAIRFYVYALRDPRDGRVFYVGKGVGDRIKAHVVEAGKDPETQQAKLLRIREIEAAGHSVDLLFLRTGIDDERTAYIAEQSVIDAFLADGHELTNLVRGHHSGTDGLASLQTVVARHHAPLCPPIPEPIIMVKIRHSWQPDSTAAEIYEGTRGHWKVGPKPRQRAKFCLGVAEGIVRGAYEIDSWFPSEVPMDQGKNLWGFHGRPAPQLAHVLGTDVRHVWPNQGVYRDFTNGYVGAEHASPQEVDPGTAAEDGALEILPERGAKAVLRVD